MQEERKMGGSAAPSKHLRWLEAMAGSLSTIIPSAKANTPAQNMHVLKLPFSPSTDANCTLSNLPTNKAYYVAVGSCNMAQTSRATRPKILAASLCALGARRTWLEEDPPLQVHS